ncbi:hypothetical protein U9M48_019822 [Paspalum notatum var. saurae]|uniref:Uncharacterized protein n=1 Tax=Paspalum notatum var. saurae TaxID=547442 RepID=A0AAQ3TD46_PASNO
MVSLADILVSPPCVERSPGPPSSQPVGRNVQRLAENRQTWLSHKVTGQWARSPGSKPGRPATP